MKERNHYNNLNKAVVCPLIFINSVNWTAVRNYEVRPKRNSAELGLSRTQIAMTSDEARVSTFPEAT
jgi:hypothetical protein